jgi:hypothetical protein
MYAKEMAETKVDPEFQRQLEEAEKVDEPVEAVLVLNGEDGSIPSPEQVDEVAGRVIDRAQRQSGNAPEDVNVFRNMASFVVRAKPRFLRTLVAQPEIASVVANRQQQPLAPVGGVPPGSKTGARSRRRGARA